MNLQFQRAVDRFVGVPVCAMLSCFDRLVRKPVVALSPRRILVILLSEMGSLVIAHSLFARLKERFPEAEVHALVFAKNREVLDLLAMIPRENVLTMDDRSLKSFAGDTISILRKLRALRLDVVIDCELFARVSSIISYFSGARVRVGFHPHTQEGLYRGTFINRPVMYNPYKHLSQQFVTLVEAVTSATVPTGKQALGRVPGPPPMVAIPAAELQQVSADLQRQFPSVKDQSLVLVYPSGGVLPIRAWPLEHYLKLCTALLRDGHVVGIIGLPQDDALGRAIVVHCDHPGCINLTGYTRSIRHLLGLFHRAALLIANDGGPGQFAALTPLPTIILFGPETPVLYGSLAKQAYCFHLPLPCSPCLTAYNNRNSPCDGDNQCLKQIAPEQVLTKAREMLGATRSASAEAGSQV